MYKPPLQIPRDTQDEGFAHHPDMRSWLVSGLVSENEHQRLKSEETLQLMGLSAIDLVMGLVRDEAHLRRKKRKRSRILAVIAFTLILAGTVASGLLLSWKGVRAFGAISLRLLMLFGGLFGAYAVSKAQVAGTKWLAQFEDPRLVGPLLDALDSDDQELQDLAEKTLVDRLPNLELRHADLLTEDQRVVLRHQLQSRNAKLVRATLGALVVLADTHAIADVEALIHRLRRQRKLNLELVTAARRAVAELQALRQHAREKETLLRPAGSAASEQLLRVPTSSGEADARRLLRPLNDP